MNLPQSPGFDLGGKRALVAGASSGIGLGAAVALAEAGAHVVMTARRTGPLEEAVEAVRDKKRVREVDMGFGDGDLDELDLGG